MIKQLTAAYLVTTALTLAPALAQTNNAQTNDAKPMNTTTQNASQTSTSTAQDAGNRNYLTQETPGTWRASKVIGLGVYNGQDQKVGDINEVLFGRSGNVEGVVIGVGGFLGIGERNVAVPYNDLKWSMTPVKSGTARMATNNPSATGMAPAAGLGSPASPVHPAPNATNEPTNSSTVVAANTENHDNAGDNKTAAYPDHAILPDASKDQLTHAPQFNYGAAPR